MKFLIVLNDPRYGTERSYNGLRLAGNLVTKHEQTEVDVFPSGGRRRLCKGRADDPQRLLRLGRAFHWQPVRSRYTIPASTSRSGTGGRPRKVFLRRPGMIGAICSHKASGTFLS